MTVHCDSLVGRADCLPPTLATLSDSTVDKSIKRRTASLADVDKEQFCFQATRPKQVDIPFFNVQDQQPVTALSIWILIFIFAFRSASLVRRSPRREHSMEESAVFFRSSLSNEALTTYVTVKANALKEASSRKGCPCRQNLRTGFVLWHPHQYLWY